VTIASFYHPFEMLQAHQHVTIASFCQMVQTLESAAARWGRILYETGVPPVATAPTPSLAA
jgi:hypothetical protein